MRSLKGKREVVAPISAPYYIVSGCGGKRQNRFAHHVTDCGHSSSRDGLYTRAEVLDNGTGTTLDGKDTSNLEDNV